MVKGIFNIEMRIFAELQNATLYRNLF